MPPDSWQRKTVLGSQDLQSQPNRFKLLQLRTAQAMADMGAARLQLSAFVFGSEAAAATHTRMQELWFSDAVVRSMPKLDVHFMSRKERYARAMLLAKRMAELRSIHALNDCDMKALKRAAFEEMPVSVHDTVYVPALQAWAIQDPSLQRAADAARTWAVLGCYAQTELAHGSNVRAIETTATYEPETDTFVLNTPTTSACKWWVGNLGRTATHAIVIARLILPGHGDGGAITDKGPHAFHIRIRDEMTHKPLAGIEIGDIGPKYSFAAVDNGFMRFHRVRVPRSALVSVTGQVTREASQVDGAWRTLYSPPEHAQAAYLGLLTARISVVSTSYVFLAHAGSIATRYSAARRQFSTAQGAEECAVLDYFAQQSRVFPLVASAYAFSTLDRTLQADFHAARSVSTDRRSLNDLHALSSAVKIFVTEYTSKALEAGRRCCGGHGYSLASGMPTLSATYVHLVTAEGDTFVLCQQVARHVLAARRRGLYHGFAGAPGLSDMSAMTATMNKNILSCTASDASSIVGMLQAAQAFVQAGMDARLIAMEAALLESPTADGWQSMQLHCFDVAYLYGLAYVLQACAKALHSGMPMHPLAASCLAAVMRVFAISQLVDAQSACRGSGSGLDGDALLRAFFDSCTRLRPLASLAVDALAVHDDALGSVLGHSSGLQYGDLLAWARKEQLNAETVTPMHDPAIKPILALGQAVLADQAREEAPRPRL